MKTPLHQGMDYVRRAVNGTLSNLHPTDEAEAYRELERWSGERAADCEDRNDRLGVPERREVEP